MGPGGLGDGRREVVSMAVHTTELRVLMHAPMVSAIISLMICTYVAVTVKAMVCFVGATIPSFIHYIIL